MENKKILITGASGFIGSILLEELSGNGNNIIAIDKDFKPDFKSAAPYKIDLSTSPRLDFVRDIDYVFHLAAAKDSAGEDICYATNVAGTKHLLRWLSKLSPKLRKFVYVGTLLSEGFGREGGRSIYGRTKLLAEKAIEEFCEKIPYLILRAARVFGPGEKRGFYSIFKFMKKGIAPLVGGMQERKASIIYIDDMIDAMMLSAESNVVNKTYCVSDGNIYTWDMIYREMARCLGKDFERLFKIRISERFIKIFLPAVKTIGKILNPSLEAQSLGELEHKDWTCNPKDFFTDIGFVPKYSLKEGMQNTVLWWLKGERIKK